MLIGVHVSKKTKGKANEARAGSCVSVGLVFANVKCVTFARRAAADFFRLSLVFKLRGCSLKLHVLLYVVHTNKLTSSPPVLSRLSKIMRQGLQTFNCIVRTTATRRFIKGPHIEQVTEK